MHIAMISSERLPVPPVRGGAVQTYINAVATRLAAQHRVTVVSLADRGLSSEEEVGGVRHVRIASPPGDAEAYLAGVIERLAAESFDVIEVFNRPLFVLPIHQVAPASRLVLSLHNEMFRETKIPPELAVPTLKVLDRVVTVSRYVAVSVQARYPDAASKIQVIYSGVDVERFVPKGTEECGALAAAARQALNLGGDPVILYVGRLSRNKGPHLLVDAMHQVLERHPQARLLVVGSAGHGSSTLTDYVEWLHEKAAPLGDRVLFTGYVSYDELPRYFALADLFVCPSQWAEPLARVHYEAMAAGLPIITTDRGGNPEVVRDGVNGIVLDDWHDPQAFARAIVALLDEPERAAEMGRRGRRLAEKRYTWDRVAHELERVLTGVKGKSSGKAAARRREPRSVRRGAPPADRRTVKRPAGQWFAVTTSGWLSILHARLWAPARARWTRGSAGFAVFPGGRDGRHAAPTGTAPPVRGPSPASRRSPRLKLRAWQDLARVSRPQMLAETLRKLCGRVRYTLALMQRAARNSPQPAERAPSRRHGAG